MGNNFLHIFCYTKKCLFFTLTSPVFCKITECSSIGKYIYFIKKVCRSFYSQNYDNKYRKTVVIYNILLLIYYILVGFPISDTITGSLLVVQCKLGRYYKIGVIFANSCHMEMTSFKKSKLYWSISFLFFDPNSIWHISFILTVISLLIANVSARRRRLITDFF